MVIIKMVIVTMINNYTTTSFLVTLQFFQTYNLCYNYILWLRQPNKRVDYRKRENLFLSKLSKKNPTTVVIMADARDKHS